MGGLPYYTKPNLASALHGNTANACAIMLSMFQSQVQTGTLQQQILEEVDASPGPDRFEQQPRTGVQKRISLGCLYFDLLWRRRLR